LIFAIRHSLSYRPCSAHRIRPMIGKLRGVIDSYGEDWVILDVGGVG
jgi:hypothetical protein